MRGIFIAVICSLVLLRSNAQISLLPDSIKRRMDTMTAKRIDKYLVSKAWPIISTDPSGALKYAKAQFEKGIELKDSSLLVGSFIVSGTVYQTIGDIPKSIVQFQNAISVCKKIHDTLRLAIALNNLGNTHLFDKDYKNALRCQTEALGLRIAKKDSTRLRSSYINLATVAYQMEDFKKAKLYTQTSLNFPARDIHEDLRAYFNLAGIFSKLKQFDSAFYVMSIAKQKLSDSLDQGWYDITIAGLYTENNQNDLAERHLNEGKKIFLTLGDYYRAEDLNMAFYTLYKNKGDYKKALFYHERILQKNDSLNSESRNLQITFLNTEYEVKEKEQQINGLLQKSALDEEEKKRIRLVRNSVIIGILFTLWLVFLSYRKSVERKKLLGEIELRNMEIKDSINYATYIQSTFLPSASKLQKNFKEHFLVYKPKDIIAGDFYWMEENDENIWFALGDCTGHGVPGALVSVVCCNALNRSIGEFGLVEPSKILDQTRQIIVNRFSQSNSLIKDGMDISLIRIKKQKTNAGTKHIQFSGANHSIIIVRDKVAHILKGDKQPIGFVEDPLPFKVAEVEIGDSDMLYFFTDGFADQFGGERGKKFKSKNLRDLLVANAHLSIEQQKKVLETTFKDWVGKLEQIDDVTVIGVKL